MSIASSIRNLRQSNQMSQEQLSEASGLTRVSITKIETGKRPVSAIEVVKLASALNVKPSMIIDEDIDQDGVNLSEICWKNPEPSRCPRCGSRLFKAYGFTYNVALDECEQTGWHCLHCCSTFESTRIGSVIRTRITGNKPVQLLPGELKELRKDSVRRSK